MKYIFVIVHVHCIIQISKKKLAVYLPNGELTLDLAHEMLGDIKYDPKGSLIKTTGFRGEHFDETDEDRRIKIPFDAGLCSSTFGDGVFMVYYARTMHFGHQGSNAIGVRTSDMSPYYLPSGKRPYISHSFMQSVIWSDRMKKFVFADQGDTQLANLSELSTGIAIAQTSARLPLPSLSFTRFSPSKVKWRKFRASFPRILKSYRPS